jgi:hypothetical protein
MRACKSHQRQIALLAVQALGDTEIAAVRNHLRDCAECRRYASELEKVVALYAHDAERPIAPVGDLTPPGARRFEAQPMPWLKWLFPPARPAVICLGMLLLAGTSFFFKKGSERQAAQAVRHQAAAAPIPAPTIGHSRHLIAAELDTLVKPEPSPGSARTEFVYSVGTRAEAYD